MTFGQQLLTIFAVILGTMLTRFLPFVLFPADKTPPSVNTYLGTVLPYAVMGLLIIYCLKDAFGGPYHALPELLAILSVFLLHKWRKNMLLSIGASTVFYMFLVQVCFL